uniref:NADH-ubiquinone oxidoreductase chain 4L n=1 Tax=Naupactus xanthographus TaxID=114905 RepID=D8WKQ9_NAUXA|nr:NADH dehydrogenase subunit 4L [Naupactus xanthographus]ACZ58592.1 NADH dehydrogenase subunit 4L [Naupactus xanthographus]
MSIYLLTFYFLYFSSLIVFASKRKHLLLMLLSLESSVVALFMGLFFMLSMVEYEFFFSMIFLTMSVCEGALGLSMLVLMIRVHGNDFILTFDSLW